MHSISRLAQLSAVGHVSRENGCSNCSISRNTAVCVGSSSF